MKRITFVQDYKGQETNQLEYKAGMVAMFPDAHADRLISDKIAEMCQPPKEVKKKDEVGK